MEGKQGILIITRGIYPFVAGGVGIHTYYVATELSKNHYITVLTGRKNHSSMGNFDPDMKKVTFRFVDVPSMPVFSSAVFVLSGLVTTLCKVKKLDVTHAHQALSPLVLAFLVHLLRRTPFIVTCHASDVRLIKNTFVRLIQRFLFSRARYLTLVSTEMKKILINAYDVDGAKIGIIRNGYDERLVSRLIENTKRECSTRIAFVGSLRPIKDPITLLKAFREIAGKYSNIRLHIVGDGPLRGLLEAFCLENNLSSKVTFEGRKSHEEALKAIAESTVFVLTSIDEGLPTVLVEAMAIGKPVIATAVGGVPEVVKDEINGMLVPPSSPEHLAKVLERLLNDSELRRKIGKAAAETVKDYTWGKIAKKYEIVYHEALRLRS